MKSINLKLSLRIPLFDVDGTLKGFTGVHGSAMNEVFTKVLGINAFYNEINVQGMIDPQIIVEVAKLHGIPEEKVKKVLPKAFEVMRDYITKHKHEAVYQILPGVKDLFVKLRENHTLIGLLTGNVPEAPEMKLGPSRLWKYVDFGAYGPEAASLKRVELVGIAQKKASQLLGRTVMLDELVIIGDTPKDIQCAKDGGIVSIGVATGMYGINDLEKAGADLVVASLKDSKTILSFLEN